MNGIEAKRKKAAKSDEMVCVLFLSLCKKTRGEIRNASLKSMAAQRKAEHVDWKNKLINS